MNWTQIYASYNDDTLTTLANAGLVRRASKDVLADKVSWLEKGDDSGALTADGQTVQLTGNGIPDAQCDCSAPGVCKHIVAAVMFVRDEPRTAAAGDALSDLLSQDLPGLFKSLGVAVVRKAAAVFADLHQAPELQNHGTRLDITASELSLTVSWIRGGGFAGMVSEAPSHSASVLHLAIILKLWQVNQQDIVWPKNVVFDAGLASAASLSKDDLTCIQQVESLVLELIELGLAHLSKISTQRLQALSLSARAEGIPRLAGMLRNISGLIASIDRRNSSIENADLLAGLAQLYAWCQAIQSADPDRLMLLRGTVQRSFQSQDTRLELLPLGAWWWEASGGAHGLSLALWEPESGEILQAVQARANALDSTFSDHAAWSVTPLWQGAGSASAICKGRLWLEQPRLAEGNSLALGGDTRGSMGKAWQMDDPRLENLGYANWTQMHRRLEGAGGLMTQIPRCLFLKPADYSEIALDEIRQETVLAVRDDSGAVLRLSMPCDWRHKRAAITLERVLKSQERPYGILVSVQADADGFRFEPEAVMLIEKEREKETIRPLVLMFSPMPAEKTDSLTSRIAALIKKQLGARKAQPSLSGVPLSKLNLARKLTNPVSGLLESMAVTGRLAVGEREQDVFRRQASQAEACGVDVLTAAFREASAQTTLSPAALLQLSYLIERSSRLML